MHTLHVCQSLQCQCFDRAQDYWAIYREEHWHTVPDCSTNFQDNLVFVMRFFSEREYFACMCVCALLVCLVPVGTWRGHHIPPHGTGNTSSCEAPFGVLGIKPGPSLLFKPVIEIVFVLIQKYAESCWHNLW